MASVWLNGRLVHEKKAHLSVFDHAFLYGDGLYETVRLYESRIFLWSAHYARLKKAAQRFHFMFPWSGATLEKAVRAVARANHRPNGSARLTLSRGQGALGLDPLNCLRPTLVIQLHPDRPLARWREQGVSAGVLTHGPLALRPDEALYKSTSMQRLVLARVEARRQRVFEGLLLNAKQQLTEGLTSNIFFVRRHILHTPALACGLLPGVTRHCVLQLARRAKIKVQENIYRKDHLLQADELFLTNTSFEIMPVKTLRVGPHVKTFGPAPVTRQLQDLYVQEIHSML